MSSPFIKLEELTLKIGSGSTPRGGESVYIDQGVSLIRSQNVYNARFFKTGLVHIDDSIAEKMKGVTVNKDDVLLNITGDSVARCCLAPQDMLPARVNQHVAIVRPNKSKLNPIFLMYYLVSPYVQKKMLSLAGSGGTRKALTKGMIQKFDIPNIELSQQQKIVSTLSPYDDLIKNNRRRINLLEQSIRLLYREWFVHFHFPDHEHVEIKNGVPDGWKDRKFKQVTTKIGSGATPRGGGAAYKSSGITLVRSMNVYDYQFTEDGLAFIDDSQAEKLSNVVVESQDVLLNITGASVGRCCMMQDHILPARVNQHVMIIRANPDQIGAHYLLSSINYERYKQRILNIARAGGATREALTKDTIQNFDILIPPPHILDAFEETASLLHQQQQTLAQQNNSLAQARDLLLPRLMNGDIAV